MHLDLECINLQKLCTFLRQILSIGTDGGFVKALQKLEKGISSACGDVVLVSRPFSVEHTPSGQAIV